MPESSRRAKSEQSVIVECLVGQILLGSAKRLAPRKVKVALPKRGVIVFFSSSAFARDRRES